MCPKSRRARGGARVVPITFPRESHNTQRTHTQRGDVSTRGARTRPSDNARARVRQIDSDTQHTTHNTPRTHNTSLGRPSARRRVDSNSDNRQSVSAGFLFIMNGLYIIYEFSSNAIYLYGDSYKWYTWYSVIYPDTTYLSRRRSAQGKARDIWGYQYLLAQMFDIQLFPTRID